MNKHATLILIRHDPRQPHRNLVADENQATALSAQPQCWLVVIGPHREKRLASLRSLLGIQGIARDGVNVIAPTEVSGDEKEEKERAPLAGRLAGYLADTGIRQIARKNDDLRIVLPADIDLLTAAGVVEAVNLYPGVRLFIGETPLDSHLRWELRRDRFRAPPPDPTTDLVGNAATMDVVRDRVARYAGLPYPVLIIGETGSGKEIVARMLHEQSGRRGLFMATNAAQLPAELAESQLFGHVKGAFTGAERDRMGRIRETEGGTFFLDEAFNLDPAVQAKLLRALNRADEGVIDVEPLGSTQRVPVHARLVVAAQQDPRLERAVAGGTPMREDLFYRVAVGVIKIPPLRERLDDLAILGRYLLRSAGSDASIDEAAITVLRRHPWPGNVRELRLVLLRAIVDGPPKAERIHADVVREALNTASLRAAGNSLTLPCALDLALKRIEVETMQAALAASSQNHAGAGRLIGMEGNAQNFKRRLAKAEARLGTFGGTDAE